MKPEMPGVQAGDRPVGQIDNEFDPIVVEADAPRSIPMLRVVGEQHSRFVFTIETANVTIVDSYASGVSTDRKNPVWSDPAQR